MPPKILRLSGGRKAEVKSYLLRNGNLLVSVRSEADRDTAVLKEVIPGDPLYKRWSMVMSSDPPPEDATILWINPPPPKPKPKPRTRSRAKTR